MNFDTLLKLLLYFTPLSFLTIGGGTSIIADMHRQMVQGYHWFTDEQFLNVFGLSRLTPGPGSLIVTMLGWKVAGAAGAIVASLAIFVPSSLLVFALAHIWGRYRGAKWQRAVEMGLAPIAAGMVLTSSFSLLEAATGGVVTWIVAGAATLVLLATRINPLYLLAGGAVVFAVAFGAG